MALPGPKLGTINKTNIQGKPPATKRPDNLPGSQPWSLGKKKGKQLKAEMARHSMDMEDRFPMHGTPIPGADSTDFRTRSRTFSDLNNMVDFGTQQQQDVDPYMSGSQSTLASDRGAAKLLHSSNNPTNYSSTTTIHKDSLGSPIWKPRVQNKKSSPNTHTPQPHQQQQQQQHYQQQHTTPHHGQMSSHTTPHSTPQPPPHSPYSTGSHRGDDRSAFHQAAYCGSAHSDYSTVSYNERHSTVLLTPPNNVYPTQDHDTEC